MAADDFVPVACDDWYQRRRQDAEGRFFMRVSDQGSMGGSHTSTRQGIYFLTADGALLGYKNAGQHAGAMRRAIRDALAKWNKFPEERRRPGAIRVEDPGPLDGGYTRKPPHNGLIVNVHARALGLDATRLVAELGERRWAPRVARDVRSARAMGLTGTPTFFANHELHEGAFDARSLVEALEGSGARP